MAQLLLALTTTITTIAAGAFRFQLLAGSDARPAADPIWVLDTAEDHHWAYRIARHPRSEGWTVDYCWTAAPIWEAYADGPFKSPHAAAAAFAAKGLHYYGKKRAAARCLWETF